MSTLPLPLPHVYNINTNRCVINFWRLCSLKSVHVVNCWSPRLKWTSPLSFVSTQNRQQTLWERCGLNSFSCKMFSYEIGQKKFQLLLKDSCWELRSKIVKHLPKWSLCNIFTCKIFTKIYTHIFLATIITNMKVFICFS